MPRYLFRARYTQEGIKGVIKEGGTARLEAVDKLLQSVGGRAEAQYWAFGEDDYLVIAELPDNVAAASVAGAVGASGAASVSTTVLLTADEIDQVGRRTIEYRPPGG
ncbi:MAG: GYD domain-containing protein [Chloroflexi bacterium]|nr:GYD domain-containing protein [Chloroflexota bacterium]